MPCCATAFALHQPANRSRWLPEVFCQEQESLDHAKTSTVQVGLRSVGAAEAGCPAWDRKSSVMYESVDSLDAPNPNISQSDCRPETGKAPKSPN